MALTMKIMVHIYETKKYFNLEIVERKQRKYKKKYKEIRLNYYGGTSKVSLHKGNKKSF